jgi:hypothetical protein
MTAPRFRQHTDGRTAVLHVGWEKWFVYAPSSKRGCRTWWEADVTGEGWSEAVLVVLPEPEVTSLVCGCGQAPDGAPGYGGGCSPGCMEPEEVSFGGVVDLVIGDPEGGIYVTDGLYPDEACGPDDVREVAAALLAAALYQETRQEAYPDPIPAEVTP